MFYYQPLCKGPLGMPHPDTIGAPCWYDSVELVDAFFTSFEEISSLCELTDKEMLESLPRYLQNDDEFAAWLSSHPCFKCNDYMGLKQAFLDQIPQAHRSHRIPAKRSCVPAHDLYRYEGDMAGLLRDWPSTPNGVISSNIDLDAEAAKIYGQLSHMNLVSPGYASLFWQLYILRNDWAEGFLRPCEPIPYATPSWQSTSEPIVLDPEEFCAFADEDDSSIGTPCDEDEEDSITHHSTLPVPDEPDSTVPSTAVKIVEDPLPVTELTLAPPVYLQDCEESSKESLIEEFSPLADRVAAPVQSSTSDHHVLAPVEVSAVLQSKVGGGGVVDKQPVVFGEESPPVDHASLAVAEESIPHNTEEQVRSTAIESIPSTPPVEEDTSPVGKDPPPILSDSASPPTHHHARKKPYQRKKKARYKILQQKWHAKRKKNAPDKRYRHRLRPSIEALARTNHEFCTRTASQAPTIPSSVTIIPCYEARLNVPSPPFTVIKPTPSPLAPNPIVACSVSTSSLSHGSSSNSFSLAHACSEAHRQTHLVPYSPSRSTKTPWSHQNRHENLSLRVTVHAVARTRTGPH